MYVRRRLDEATETYRERPEEETRWREGGFCFCFVLRGRGCRFKREKGLIEEMRCKTQLETSLGQEEAAPLLQWFSRWGPQARSIKHHLETSHK